MKEVKIGTGLLALNLTTLCNNLIKEARMTKEERDTLLKCVNVYNKLATTLKRSFFKMIEEQTLVDIGADDCDIIKKFFEDYIEGVLK